MDIETTQRRHATARRLKQQEKVFGIMIANLTWSGVVPLISRRDLDFVLFEMEHNHYSWTDLDSLLRAANGADLTSIVRIADMTYSNISKALDLGADGILVPRIESVGELEQVITSMRLPPRGRKGVGGYDFAVEDLPSKLANYNETKLLLVQVENLKAVADLPAMLQTGEVAGVIVGPYDLSVSLGVPGDFEHPLFADTIHEVVDVCAQARVSCGMFLATEKDLRKWRAAGMNILWSGSDLSLFSDGYNRLCDVIDEID